GSLTKSFGPEAYQTAKRIVQSGLGHFIATDAHHQDRRRPILSAAAAIAADLAGEEYALAMVSDNQEGLVNDLVIPFQTDHDIDTLLGKSKKKSWFAFWK